MMLRNVNVVESHVGQVLSLLSPECQQFYHLTLMTINEKVIYVNFSISSICLNYRSNILVTMEIEEATRRLRAGDFVPPPDVERLFVSERTLTIIIILLARHIANHNRNRNLNRNRKLQSLPLGNTNSIITGTFGF